MKITLDDVKIAVKILLEWERQNREVEKVLRRYLGKYSGYGTRSGDPVLQLAREIALARSRERGEEEELESDIELTEEEKRRLEELKKELSKK